MTRHARALPSDAPGNAWLLLSVAAAIEFPDGSISRSSLEREWKRGNLTCARVAGKLMTSRNNIAEMVEKCRAAPPPPVSGCDQPRETAPLSGASLRADGEQALIALNQRLKPQKPSLPTTSPRAAPPPSKNNVIPIMSG